MEQRRGYGTKVVWATIERCRQLGADILTVLGNPAYYQRFGFEPASQHGMAIDGKEFGDAFMVMELTKGTLHEAHGLLRWHPAFRRFGGGLIWEATPSSCGRRVMLMSGRIWNGEIVGVWRRRFCSRRTAAMKVGLRSTGTSC